jgi:general secretion pathway protein A
VVLIVDEAQGLNPELLEEIRLLSNLETSKSKLLQIVLVGQPELNKTLLRPDFRQLKQRINMRYHLPPLSCKETKEYVEKRLRIAGAQGAIFTNDAINEIYDRSGGIPRLVNIICDNALLNGYAQDQKAVDRKSVREAAKDLDLEMKGSVITRNIRNIGVAAIVIAVILSAGYLIQTGHWFPIYREILGILQTVQGYLTNGFHYVSNYVS